MAETQRAQRGHVPALLKVALIDLPPMLESIVEAALEAASGFERIRWSGFADSYGSVADVFVVGATSDVDANRAHDILARCPEARVLQARFDGTRASVYELQPCKSSLGELSPSQLVQALRVGSFCWDSWAADG